MVVNTCHIRFTLPALLFIWRKQKWITGTHTHTHSYTKLHKPNKIKWLTQLITGVSLGCWVGPLYGFTVQQSTLALGALHTSQTRRHLFSLTWFQSFHILYFKEKFKIFSLQTGTTQQHRGWTRWMYIFSWRTKIWYFCCYPRRSGNLWIQHEEIATISNRWCKNVPLLPPGQHSHGELPVSPPSFLLPQIIWLSS